MHDIHSDIEESINQDVYNLYNTFFGCYVSSLLYNNLNILHIWNRIFKLSLLEPIFVTVYVFIPFSVIQCTCKIKDSVANTSQNTLLSPPHLSDSIFTKWLIMVLETRDSTLSNAVGLVLVSD